MLEPDGKDFEQAVPYEGELMPHVIPMGLTEVTVPEPPPDRTTVTRGFTPKAGTAIKHKAENRAKMKARASIFIGGMLSQSGEQKGGVRILFGHVVARIEAKERRSTRDNPTAKRAIGSSL
jgi:hypothetical protein